MSAEEKERRATGTHTEKNQRDGDLVHQSVLDAHVAPAAQDALGHGAEGVMLLTELHQGLQAVHDVEIDGARLHADPRSHQVLLHGGLPGAQQVLEVLGVGAPGLRVRELAHGLHGAVGEEEQLHFYLACRKRKQENNQQQEVEETGGQKISDPQKVLIGKVQEVHGVEAADDEVREATRQCLQLRRRLSKGRA